MLAQAAEQAPQLLELLREYGAIAVLALFVLAWFRGWLFGAKSVEKMEKAWDARLDDMTAERNTWRDLAINGTEIAGRAIRVAEESK